MSKGLGELEEERVSHRSHVATGDTQRQFGCFFPPCPLVAWSPHLTPEEEADEKQRCSEDMSFSQRSWGRASFTVLQMRQLAPPWRSLSPSHSQWFSVLSQVHASTDQEIREMHDEQANPQNAVVREHFGVAGNVRGRQGAWEFLGSMKCNN